MSFTGKEVSEKVSEFEESGFDVDYEGSIYQKLHYGHWEDKKKTEVEVPGLGTLTYIDSYGGEGQGDDYWVVFKLGKQHFRVDGWYSSYEGGELDGEPYEVTPKEVKAIEWVRKD